MRKMIPDGRGSRVHFSIPDHEWEWFVLTYSRSVVRPLDTLEGWARAGYSPAAMRSLARNRISCALTGGSPPSACPKPENDNLTLPLD